MDILAHLFYRGSATPVPESVTEHTSSGVPHAPPCPPCPLFFFGWTLRLLCFVMFCRVCWFGLFCYVWLGAPERSPMSKGGRSTYLADAAVKSG